MRREFKLQLYGSELIFMKLHGSRLSFFIARFLIALFLFVRVPYWLVTGMLGKRQGRQSIATAKTYLIGAIYCIVGWKNLLMNKNAAKKY
jgi:hypothetical protein